MHTDTISPAINLQYASQLLFKVELQGVSHPVGSERFCNAVLVSSGTASPLIRIAIDALSLFGNNHDIAEEGCCDELYIRPFVEIATCIRTVLHIATTINMRTLSSSSLRSIWHVGGLWLTVVAAASLLSGGKKMQVGTAVAFQDVRLTPLALSQPKTMTTMTTTTSLSLGTVVVRALKCDDVISCHDGTSLPMETVTGHVRRHRLIESSALEESLRKQQLSTRSRFVRQTNWIAVAWLSAIAAQSTPMAARAFEGGVGGLGKTKPETGCRLFDETLVPIQNERGIITAEIQSVTGRPILVEFQTPWPLLPTSGGLEARDLMSSESAFVQVLPAPPSKGGDWRGNKKVFQQLLLDSVFASKGKFGAYGTPSDVRVKPNEATADAGYVVTFTTLTPAMRESERQAYIKPQEVDGTLVLLVVGTTRARFPANEKSFQEVVASFQAIAAPESNLRGSRQ